MIKMQGATTSKSCFRIGAVHAYTNQIKTVFEQMQTSHRKDAKNDAKNDRTYISGSITCHMNSGQPRPHIQPTDNSFGRVV